MMAGLAVCTYSSAKALTKPATMIARDWNVPASGVGYVTRFEVRCSFLDRYEVHQVGGRTILEYWIPAEDLDELNANIVGTIDVVAEYR